MALSTRKPWLFSDKARNTITAHERIEALIENGFLFEACAVQAMVVEAMLFLSIVAGSLSKEQSESKQIRRRLGSLTFGGLLRRAREYQLLASSLLSQLDHYRDERNFLVHHHLGKLDDFDYSAFLEQGKPLLDSMFLYTRHHTHKRMDALGLPYADQFT